MPRGIARIRPRTRYTAASSSRCLMPPAPRAAPPRAHRRLAGDAVSHASKSSAGSMVDVEALPRRGERQRTERQQPHHVLLRCDHTARAMVTTAARTRSRSPRREPVMIRPGQLSRHVELRGTQTIDERTRPGDGRYRNDARSGGGPRRRRTARRAGCRVRGARRTQPPAPVARRPCERARRSGPQQGVRIPGRIQRLAQTAAGQHGRTVYLLVAREQQVDIARELQVLKPIVEHVDIAPEPPLRQPAAEVSIRRDDHDDARQVAREHQGLVAGGRRAPRTRVCHRSRRARRPSRPARP